MKNSSEIKITAKSNLKGNWGKAIIVYLIYFIILSGISYVMSFKIYPNLFQYFMDLSRGNFNGIINANSNLENILIRVSYVINILFYGVLTYGVTSFFLNLTKNRQANVIDILDGFKKYGKCILTSVLNFIFVAGWFLLVLICFSIISSLFIVGVGMILSFFALSSSVPNETLTIFVVAIFMFILIVGFYFAFFIFISRYSFVYYLIKDCETNSIMDYFRQSKIMMSGNYRRYIYLNLSFLGWIILSIITLSLGSIYVVPYYRASMAIFYEEVLNDAMIKGKMIHVYLNKVNADLNNSKVTYTI